MLRRTLCLVLVASFAAVVLSLAGCSESSEDRSGKVVVLMWSQYFDPELETEFERQTGLDLEIISYETTDQMIAKLRQAGGASQYDLVVVSDHAVPKLAEQGLLQPLDPQRIPNHVNVAERFLDPAYDPGNRYSLPYQWGTEGILYRKDRVADPARSWAVILDPAQQPAPVVLIEDMRDMMGLALIYNGQSPNSTDPQALQAAGQTIIAAKQSPLCIGFEGSVGGGNRVVAGEAAMAIMYSGDALAAIEKHSDIELEYFVPQEGSIFWVDVMAVTSQAPNADGAHRFINFVLDAENGAQLSNYLSFATPNQASMPMIDEEALDDPAIYPPEEVMERLQPLENVGEATRLYDEVWTNVKAR